MTEPNQWEGDMKSKTDFVAMFLVWLYGPEKPFFDKTWKLPDIEKVK
jgi:hypothetical protein